jgi:hypothetical protein
LSAPVGDPGATKRSPGHIHPPHRSKQDWLALHHSGRRGQEMAVVHALRSEQVWPSNVRNCPQSRALGQHVSWKTAPYLACSIDIL